MGPEATGAALQIISERGGVYVDKTVAVVVFVVLLIVVIVVALIDSDDGGSK